MKSCVTENCDGRPTHIIRTPESPMVGLLVCYPCEQVRKSNGGAPGVYLRDLYFTREKGYPQGAIEGSLAAKQVENGAAELARNRSLLHDRDMDPDWEPVPVPVIDVTPTAEEYRRQFPPFPRRRLSLRGSVPSSGEWTASATSTRENVRIQRERAEGRTVPDRMQPGPPLDLFNFSGRIRADEYGSALV